MLVTLFKNYFEICLLRKNPQDLPRSTELLAVSLALYIAISTLVIVYTAPLATAMASSVIEILLVSLITWVILRLHKKPERLMQTLTAIVGTGCIISLFAIPLIYSGMLWQTGEVLQSVAALLYLALVIWNIMVLGHILRHALATTLGFGIVFAIIYIVITTYLISLAFPAIGPQ
ncbi:MAG: hypothetical protein GWO08_12845 [Gammaproteobacteria bacterium]|nr:hypothetical protein [Gammaproteobacteria bacterium]NIN60948.1 hypothetical protein [Gammaproteobacteria bacterium]NIO62572.1 hypothetical protein [Gammaproteobacteria bacterium]NIP49511.1 hypothetical protein [Gammaproteobacteria bacterium]NIQ10735.1 hypothetical protein [Gammaproteobacteria bacterium]